MKSAQTAQQRVTTPGYLTGGSVGILLIHFYLVGHSLFEPANAGPLGAVIDRLREVFQRLPFTGDGTIAKASALLLLLFSYFFSGGKPRRRDSYVSPAIGAILGLLLYFGSGWIGSVETDPDNAKIYLVITSIGFLLITYGMGGVANYWRYRVYLQQFQRDTGFRQEEQLIETEYSLNFPATYQFNGRKRKSWINIINPRRGVLIMGSPGSGKSWFLIEPMIEQLVRQGRALFVYDFKYPVLTQFTYHQFLKHAKNYPSGARFYCINFTEVSQSHRCNLIDPATLKNKNDASGISRTIFTSMNRTWAARQGEFFIESSISYLAALIWYLKIYKDGIYCTLPHVIELSKTSYEELFTLLSAEPETRGLIGPFREAYLNKTTEMLDGQVASARIPLNRLDSPDFYYVLSGNDLKLDINDPKTPTILCLGGDPQRSEALAPVLSLYIDRLNRTINRSGRYPSALVLDEFATVRATSVLNTIATGRSNNIIPILAVQDLTQLTQQYSRDEAHQVMNTAGNIICGQVTGETATLVSKRFHANAFLKTTVSVNSSDTSVSQTEYSEDAVTPATLAQLSAGEFIGVVADDPQERMEIKGFHASFSKDAVNGVERRALPDVAEVTEETVKENFLRIGREIEELVRSERERILGDPALQRYVVKR